ncbi:MAG: hypothetical protein ACK5JO_17105, partial [Halodesulfovibrio sp.]
PPMARAQPVEHGLVHVEEEVCAAHMGWHAISSGRVLQQAGYFRAEKGRVASRLIRYYFTATQPFCPGLGLLFDALLDDGGKELSRQRMIPAKDDPGGRHRKKQPEGLAAFNALSGCPYDRAV